MTLIVDVKWHEPYSSAALNRKLAGILEAGVYWGFQLSPGPGLTVRVGNGADPDYPVSLAVIERDGYSLTTRLDGDETVAVPSSGAVDIVIEASYLIGQDSAVALKAVAAAASHHVVLGRITVPAGASAMTAAMISDTGRSEANPAIRIAGLVTRLTSLSTSLIDARARLANLERWAGAQGFHADTLY